MGGIGVGGDTQLGYVVFTKKESGAEQSSPIIKMKS